MPRRLASARLRVNVCGALGVVVGVCGALVVPWQLAMLTGWCVASAAFLIWVWAVVAHCSAAETRELATAEDDSRHSGAVVMILASVISLGGVVVGLAKARAAGGATEVALTVVALLAVVLSWSVVHTVFALRYAHLYYSDPIGGIAFPGDAEPDYLDFAYVAVTVGVAFAVSDTDVSSAPIRRSITRHSLISYLFGAVIVGLTINVLASIFGPHA